MLSKERKILIDKISKQIYDIKSNILSKLPHVHTIDDGIIIRFFVDWDYCDDNTKIRYKKIKNFDDNKKIIFFFIPKKTHIEFKKRDYVNDIICLNGNLELNTPEKTYHINSYTKINIDSEYFQGKTNENTYLITISK